MHTRIRYEKSCGIVLVNRQNILLLHYPSGHWDFPKGHVQSQESEQQTASRELHEETGIISPVFDQSFRICTEYAYKRHAITYKKKVVYFLGTTDTSFVTLSDEHQAYAWLSWQDTLKRITFDSSKAVLQYAEQHYRSGQSAR